MKRIMIIMICLVSLTFAYYSHWKEIDYAMDNGSGVHNLTGSEMKVFWYVKSGNEKWTLKNDEMKSLSEFRGSKELPSYDDTCYINVSFAGTQLEVKAYQTNNKHKDVYREVYLINGNEKKLIAEIEYTKLAKMTYNRNDFIKIYKNEVKGCGKTFPIK